MTKLRPSDPSMKPEEGELGWTVALRWKEKTEIHGKHEVPDFSSGLADHYEYFSASKYLLKRKDVKRHFCWR